MRGERKLTSKRDDESFLDLYIRNTDLKNYGMYRTAFNHLKEFVEEKDYKIIEIGDKEVKEFCKHLESKIDDSQMSLSPKGADLYLSTLSRLFGWVATETKHIDWEPFSSYEGSYFEFDNRKNKKRDLPICDLRQGIRNIENPTLFTFVLLLLKTGLRTGEAINLDLRDINLDHQFTVPVPDPRPEVSSKPNTLHVDSSKSGNKPNSYREVPIDDELKRTLIWYIQLTPPRTEQPSPLFTNLGGSNTKYDRISKSAIKKQFRDWADRQGWFIEPHHPENIHPHWCRHWFTTILRKNISDSDVPIGNTANYVGGLRGDTGNDIIETYTHQWNEMVSSDELSYREVYISAMPALLSEPDSPSVDVIEPWQDTKEFVESTIEVER